MPISILSLPTEDLQYTLNCMDIGDLKDMDRGEVLRGIKFQIVGHECRLKRADGDELTIDIGLRHVSFTFRR
ncbi:unnamed protein product [Caenorhabditis nigoni]